MQINWIKVVAITLCFPVVGLAAIGVVAIAGDLEFRTLTRQLWSMLMSFGERISYGGIVFACVGVTYLATRQIRDRWWLRNGEAIATQEVAERYRVVQRERNAAEYRLKIRTQELRAEQARAKGAHLALERAATSCGQAQLALSGIPADRPVEELPTLRRVN